MNKYENSFYLFNGEAKQIPIIPMHGAPTEDTEGAVGLILMDVDAPGCPMYKCVEVTEEGNSVWEPFVDRALYEKDVFQAYSMGYGDGVDDTHTLFFKNKTDWSGFNYDGYNWDTISKLSPDDTSNGTDFSQMFFNAHKNGYKELPNLDTSKGKRFYQTFAKTQFSSVPNISFKNATDLCGLFEQCTYLENVEIDTPKVVYMTDIFVDCKKIQTIKFKTQTSYVEQFTRAFSGNPKLTCIEGLNTSKATNMGSMFNGTYSMQNYPEMDTSKVYDFSYTFYGTSNTTYPLKTIPKLNLSKAGSISNMFSTAPSMQFETINFEGTIGVNGLNLSGQNNLSHDSLMSMINALADKTGDTSTTWKVIIGSTNLAKLTDAEKQIAIDKNWTLA